MRLPRRGCGRDTCRVVNYYDDGSGCPGCGWPDERDADSGMTRAEAARWLATLSRSPRYSGDRWRRLIDEQGNVEHAVAAARRNADPDQIPMLRAVEAQLAPTGGS